MLLVSGSPFSRKFLALAGLTLHIGIWIAVCAFLIGGGVPRHLGLGPRDGCTYHSLPERRRLAA